MKKLNFTCSILFLGALLFLTSCSPKWYDSFEKAAEVAKKKNQDIIFLLSGDSWDGNSLDFKKNVINTSDFNKTFAKDFILLNIDVEDSAKNTSSLPIKIKINHFPSIYVLTMEGWLLKEIPYSQEVKDFSEFKTRFNTNQANLKKLSDLASSVRKSQGLDQVMAINSFYESLPSDYRKSIEELFQKVIDLDPNDESGLLGKFELLNAYSKAEEDIKRGDIKAACLHFDQLATKDSLTAEQKQEAYYSQALIIISSFSRGSYNLEDFNKVYDLLQKSYEASPNGIHSADIERVKKYVEEALEASK